MRCLRCALPNATSNFAVTRRRLPKKPITPHNCARAANATCARLPAKEGIVVEIEYPALLGERFRDALVYAAELHQDQVRKGTRIPYVAHLLSAAAMVIEDGGDEDEAIAALLHDAVEDRGGRQTLEAIRSRFGQRVADIVEACSDAYVLPKPPWRERKEAYLNHLACANASVLRVALADKLHNARAILLDYREVGENLWQRFNAPRDDTLWYYRAVLDTLRPRTVSPLVEELARTLDQLEDLVRCRTQPEGEDLYSEQ